MRLKKVNGIEEQKGNASPRDRSFSKEFATFEDWQRIAQDTHHKKEIERLHKLHPTATLSQLRRHPGKGQKPLGEVAKQPPSKLKWEDLTSKERELRLRSRKVFFEVRSERSSLDAACASYHISPETVRRHVDGFVKEDGRWRIKRVVKNEVSMRIYHRGGEQYIIIPDVLQASIIGRYNNAVKQYLRTHNDSFLEPFFGQIIKASDGKIFHLETDPEKLYMLWERKPEEQQRPIYDELG